MTKSKFLKSGLKCRFSVNAKQCLECKLFEKCWQKYENKKAVKNYWKNK